MDAPPSYTSLTRVGYRFTNHGKMLGDRKRDGASCWYGVTAPDGSHVGSVRGISSAYAAACKHYAKQAGA
jgi:hypothetical protein